jgi:hypothetical protein
MRKIPALFCLLLIGCLHVNAQTIVNVFPGDANNSGKCTHHDLLYIGLGYGETGPARGNASLNWQAQQATIWAPSGQHERAFMDCDGNGTIERGDALGIDQNFGLLQNGGFFNFDTTTFSTGNVPVLQLGIGQDSILVNGLTTVVMDVNLGSPGLPVDSLYGLAFTLSFDPGIVDNATMAFNPGSFISQDSNWFSFSRIDTALGKIYMAISRTDHQNRSGSGTIASIGIVMDDNIRINGNWSLVLHVDSAFALTATEDPVYLRPQGDTIAIMTGHHAPSPIGISLAPNPARDRVVIRSENDPLQAVRLYDPQGRLIAQHVNLSSQYLFLEIDQLAAGCYFVEVQVNDGILRKKLILQPY